MWFNFIKLKRNYLLNYLTPKDLRKKIKLFNEKKITKIFDEFVSFKRVFFNFNKKLNVLNLMIFYLNVKKVLFNKSIKNFNNVLQIKTTKKQLFSTIFNKKKTIFFISNGFFLKKLLLKKHQKKDSKVSILNLKKIIEFFQKKNFNNLIINVMYSKTLTIKYINFLKTSLKKKNILFLYSPCFSFSQNRFKKVKSIKRKLKKKYVFSV